MRRYSLAVRRLVLALSCIVLASLSVVASAQAIVVHDGSTEAGVSMMPAVRGGSLPSGVTAATSPLPCTDPWLTSDLGAPFIPRGGMCYRGGSVLHQNEAL